MKRRQAFDNRLSLPLAFNFPMSLCGEGNWMPKEKDGCRRRRNLWGKPTGQTFHGNIFWFVHMLFFLWRFLPFGYPFLCHRHYPPDIFWIRPRDNVLCGRERKSKGENPHVEKCQWQLPRAEIFTCKSLGSWKSLTYSRNLFICLFVLEKVRGKGCVFLPGFISFLSCR